MSTLRNTPALVEALAAWRGFTETQRQQAIAAFYIGGAVSATADVRTMDAAIFLLRRAAEPESKPEFPCAKCGVMLSPWPNWIASQMASTAGRCPECGHPCDAAPGGAP